MQKVVYVCDECNKPIGDVPHISLGLNKGLSGLAVPPKMSLSGYHDSWQVVPVKSGFMHFHLQCIEGFFKQMGDDYFGVPKKKK